MKKNKTMLLLLLFCLLFPTIQSKADIDLNTINGNEWDTEFRGSSYRYKSHYSVRPEGKGIRQKVSYDDEAEVALQFGYTWYDQEELWFSEMTQVHGTREAAIQWKSPDVLFYGSNITTIFIEDTSVGKNMERVRMLYNWQEAE